MKKNFFPFVLILVLVCHVSSMQADQLDSVFQNPPQEARPRVWWHWMNGNITQDGIRKDLQWMHRMGIAGVHIFEANLETPVVVSPKVVYMTPTWKRCFHTAVRTADSLGMEVAMMATPGWSNTGGPWVKPADAMKKLVWRTLDVKGGHTLRVQLPAPYTVSGSFQNVAAQGTASKKEFYADVALVAVRLPDEAEAFGRYVSRITSSGGPLSLQVLTDGDVTTAVRLPADSVTGTHWVQIDLSRTVEIRSLSLADGQMFSQFRWMRPTDRKWLEASVDGVHFHKVMNLPNGSCSLSTLSFPGVSGKSFRLVWQRARRPITLGELDFSLAPRVNHAEEKAAFGTPTDIGTYPTPSAEGVALADVIDLTGQADAMGRLTWKAPRGNWRIFRFGCSLTGKMNHPAPREATGLEVDKLDSVAVSRYLDHYFSLYDDVDTLGRGITSLLMDSYEAGIANWTRQMREEFLRRRGYDLRPWMPVLAGVIVDNSERTDRFLFDFRRTIGELLAENLYGQINRRVKALGMTTYFQGHETCRVMTADGMDIKRQASFPMGAMWASLPVMNYSLTSDLGKQGDTHESASVAHIFGQNIASAESMTCNGLDGNGLAYSLWGGNLKPVVDLEFANGINRVVIHSSDHQPDDVHIPGVSLGIYGQWFHRHETWAEHARPWVDYISRTSSLLQQGQYVADVAYYYGQDNNVTGLFSGKLPPVPLTHSFDYVNPYALLYVLQEDGGSLTTPSGMRYRLLALDGNARRMTLPELQKIAAWVKAGVAVCGQKPFVPLSLTDDDRTFHALADDLWSGRYPNVHTGTVTAVLDSIGVQPDFSCIGMDSLRFVHRSLADAEIYWVNNRSFSKRKVRMSFRVAGLKPQLWNPETGSKADVPYAVHNGHTYITLPMQAGEATFVVFRGQGTDSVAARPMHAPKVMQTISTPWQVAFYPRFGAPWELVTDSLVSYTKSADPAIRYFSGRAVYRNVFKLQQPDLASGRICLSLGRVGCLAEVTVNGRYLGQLWHAPYEMDITEALHRGVNHLEVEVINMWRNRIIGDRQPDCQQPLNFVSYPFYQADSPLQPSGLMGPVKIIRQ